MDKVAHYNALRTWAEKNAASLPWMVRRIANKAAKLKLQNPEAYQNLGGDEFLAGLKPHLSPKKVPVDYGEGAAAGEAIASGSSRLDPNKALIQELGKKVREAEAKAAREALLKTTADTPNEVVDDLRRAASHTDKLVGNYPVSTSANSWLADHPTVKKWLPRAGVGAGLLAAYNMGGASEPPPEQYPQQGGYYNPYGG